MNTIKSTLIIVLSIFFLSSCGDDLLGIDDCDASSYEEQIPALVMSFGEALQNYGTNPTVENCQVLRREYNSYLNFLKDYEDCPFTFNGGQLREAIRQGEMDIEELTCS